MITIEMFEGGNLQFNLPEDKEKKFLEMYLNWKNKSVTMKTKGEDVVINFNDIQDCYIGEKEKKTNPFNTNENPFKEGENIIDFLMGFGKK